MKTIDKKSPAELAREWARRQKIHSVTNIATFNAESAQRAIKQVAARKRPNIAVRQFDAAKSTELLADFTGRQSSANTDIYNGFAKLLFRAKELSQNNPYARRFLTVMANNVIGPHGIKMQMDVKDPDGTPDERANNTIEKAWEQFSMRDFTTSGTVSRQLFEVTSVKCLARDGELLIRLVPGFRENRWRFAVMMLDPALLDYEYNDNLQNGNFIRMGIEFNGWRRPVAYHFRSQHYGDVFSRPGNRFQRERIPAEEIIHAYIPDHPDQWRGVTWFHAAMVHLRHIGATMEAMTINARVGASKMGFFTQPADEDRDYTGDDVDADGNLIGESIPGTFESLPPGMSFQSWDPAFPNADVGPFITAMLKGVSAGLNVSYPTLAADLEGVNYSSIRAGILEDRDYYKLLHHFYINTVERRIFERWLGSYLLTTETNLPAAKFDKFNAPKFAGRKWPWVDPLKDIQAERLAIEAGLKSRSQSVAESGEDYKQVLDQIAKDQEMELEKLGYAQGITTEDTESTEEEEED